MIDISTLTRAQQEQLYDQLRVALGLDEEAAGSIPEWHEAVVRERIAELERGEAGLADWQDFIRELRAE